MTQAAIVLRHLELVGPITPLEALRLHGVFRLAAVVHALKKDGHDIATEMIVVKKAGGADSTVASYRLRVHAGAQRTLFASEGGVA